MLGLDPAYRTPSGITLPPEALSVAATTLRQFGRYISRLYEQDSTSQRVRDYIKQFQQWGRSELSQCEHIDPAREYAAICTSARCRTLCSLKLSSPNWRRRRPFPWGNLGWIVSPRMPWKSGNGRLCRIRAPPRSRPRASHREHQPQR
jgi:hypothetical protein